MKMLIIAAMTLVSATAFARPDTAQLTCRDAAGLVADNGAVTLNTGSLHRNRYVSHPGLCGGNEVAVKAFVQTIDKGACGIGFVCQTASRDLPSAFYVKVGPKGCKEGTVFTEYDRDNGNKTFVCSAGKYRQVGGKAPSAPVYRGCKEGATFTNYDRDNGNETFVCRGGRYVKRGY